MISFHSKDKKSRCITENFTKLKVERSLNLAIVKMDIYTFCEALTEELIKV